VRNARRRGTHPVVDAGGDADVVDHGQVLHVLAQAHAACAPRDVRSGVVAGASPAGLQQARSGRTSVRAHGLLELGGHQHDSQHLVHAAQAAGVDLRKGQGKGGGVDAGMRRRRRSPDVSDAHSRARACTMSMAPDVMSCLNMMRFWQCSPVATQMPYLGNSASRTALWPKISSGEVGSCASWGVWAKGEGLCKSAIGMRSGGTHLDPPRLEPRQLVHPLDGLPHAPLLVGVHLRTWGAIATSGGRNP